MIRHKAQTTRSHSGPCTFWTLLNRILLTIPGLLFTFLLIPCASRGKIDVNLHAIVPEHFVYTKELESTFLLSFPNFVRNRGRYSNVFRTFSPTNNITFLRESNPEEILRTFCRDVVGKNNTVTLLTINNPSFLRGSNRAHNYIMELAQHLGIPVISWDSDYPGSAKDPESSLALQIAPTIQHQARAIFSLLQRYNWTQFTVVTTLAAGHQELVGTLQAIARHSQKQAKLLVATQPNIRRFTMLRWVLIRDASNATMVRFELSKLIGTDARIMILHSGSNGASLNILEGAAALNLTGQQFQWILTQQSMDRSSRVHPSIPIGTLGITFDNQIGEMTEAIQKAVKIWFAALLDMSRFQANLSAITFPGKKSCNDSSSLFWPDGRTLYNHLLNIYVPSEPQLRFDKNGSLQHTELMIFNAQWGHTEPDKKQWQEVGRWMRNGLIMRDIVWPGGSSIPPTGRPERRFLRVATLEEKPYVMYEPRGEDDTCGQHAVKCRVYLRNKENKKQLSNETVPRCCTGLSVDLLRVFSRELNFDFDMFEVEDGMWGAVSKETGEWNGLIKALLDRKADMVLTSLKINPDRNRAVTFSVPYLETGITIVVSLREGAISPTAFLEPFDITSWILILMLCIHVVALGVYIFEWLSPIGLNRGDNAKEPYDYPSWCLILVFSVHATGASIFIFEWLSPYGLNRGKSFFPDHKFSLFRSFWLIWAMLFSAAVDTDTPKGVSSRFLANIWALFAVVFLASYTANLAAFMITKEEYYDLSGIQDPRLQNPQTMKPPFKYATIHNGSTETNIRNNHPKMFAYMKSLNKQYVWQGIQAVKDGEIHAFIYDATVLEYWAGKDPKCKLRTVGNWYAMTGYGVAFPPGPNPWVEKINEVIFELQQNGEMERLQKFWLAGACYSRKDKKGVTNKTLGILNFTSAFILLGGGVLLSVLLLMLEFLYYRFGRRCLKKTDKYGCCGYVSLSLKQSLSVEDTVRESMSLARRKRCRDKICDTQIWRLRHELDLALLKIENLQNQLTVGPSAYEMEKMARAVGRELDYTQHNGWPRRQAARDVSTDNSLLGEDSCDSRSEGGGSRIRRSPSYTFAVGGDLMTEEQKPSNRSRYHEGKVYVGVDSNADAESAL